MALSASAGQLLLLGRHLGCVWEPLRDAEARVGVVDGGGGSWVRGRYKAAKKISGGSAVPDLRRGGGRGHA